MEAKVLGTCVSRGIGRQDYSAPEQANRSTGIMFQVKVVTPGTPVQLPNILIPAGFSLTLSPLPENKGLVYPQYIPTATTTDRMPLDSGQPEAFPVKNANIIYLDADNAGDGITGTVVQ